MIQLWEREKKLILLLDKIRYFERLLEGSRKTRTGLEGEEVPQSIGDDPRFLRAPTLFNLERPRNDSWQGGTIENKLAFLRSSIEGSSQSLAQQNCSFIFPKTVDRLSDTRLAKWTKELTDARNMASALSVDILTVRREYNLAEPECDIMSPKDIDIKLGGDGTFQNSDGERQTLPSTPLSKTCTGRKGQVGKDRVWLLECVLCPVYYANENARIKQWLEFSLERKTQKYEEKDNQEDTK